MRVGRSLRFEQGLESLLVERKPPRLTGSPFPRPANRFPRTLTPPSRVGRLLRVFRTARRWISAGHYASTSPTVRAEISPSSFQRVTRYGDIPAFLGSIPPDIRLIVVDASSDDNPRCIGEIRPNNTVVLRYPGIIAEARNAGTAAARTSWLVFTDADVTFALDFFDRLMQHPLSDAVYGPERAALRPSRGFWRWDMNLISHKQTDPGRFNQKRAFRQRPTL